MVVGKPASTNAAELAADRLLVESAQQDQSKFGDLYDKYFCLVYAYTARRVGDRATAEDLTSEVFQKALEYLPKFVWRGVPFGAWLLRIATNIVVDRTRQAARERPLADQEDATEISHFSLEEAEELQGGRIDPVEVFDYQEDGLPLGETKNERLEKREGMLPLLLGTAGQRGIMAIRQGQRE